MSMERSNGGLDAPEGGGDAPGRSKNVSLLGLSAVLFRIGATTFGGMWAATQKLEAELVDRKQWLKLEEQRALMLAATVIPAPKFLAFGGMVGFRLRGWPGAMVALVSLFAPAGLFVLSGAALFNPDHLGGPMVPLSRAVGIAVVGLLLGNAYYQLSAAKVTGRKKAIGIVLAIAVAAATTAGGPMLLIAIAALTAGAFLIRDDQEEVR